MDKVRYFFREALRNVWVNRMMSLASVGVLGVCLVLLGTSVLLSMNLHAIARKIDNQNQIMVFLNSKLTQQQVDEVGNQIRALPNVKNCIFVSTDEAFTLEKKKLGQYSDLLNGLNSKNFLPSSYRIVLRNLGKYSQTVSQLKKISGITDINQNASTVAKLNRINRVVQIVGLWLFVILAMVSLFIISNTIKLALYVRKREVNIMKFVGATDWFIRWPFILEGCVIGLIAGVVAFFFQWYIYDGLLARAIQGLDLIHLVWYANMHLYILLAFVLTGLLLGAAGSLFSVRKYLKV